MLRLGVDRVDEFAPLFAGRRAALCAGAASVGSDFRSTLRHVSAHCRLALLLEPEHGLRGALQPGAEVVDRVDEETGLACVSLFSGGFGGGREAALDDALKEIDLVIFDMQDAGTRFFTYTSTLLDILRACSRAGKEVCVLDRPNPLGGLVLEGGICERGCMSFIGCAPLPIRHGLTMGEMAGFLKEEYGLTCPVRVAAMEGWSREMEWEPPVPPSPNLPGMKALRLYPGICLLAGTNLTEGRGTAEPFSLIGAPYVRPEEFAGRLDDMRLPGLRFSAAWFMPQFSKYAGQLCGGARLHVVDPAALRSVDAGVRIIRLAMEMYPEFSFRPPDGSGRWHVDLSSGSSDLRNPALSADKILARWRVEEESFQPRWQKHLLYPCSKGLTPKKNWEDWT